MKLKKEFKDFTIVNRAGNIEYAYVYNPAFFGFVPEDAIGRNFCQIYTNLSQETSTCMRAIHKGEVIHNHEQILERQDGMIVREYEDVYVVKRGGQSIAAIELANYDESVDLLRAMEASRPGEEDEKLSLDSLVGSSPEMTDLKRKISKVADVDSAILLMGETGTGKELTARVIHALSNRREAPFIYVNCSALPENLLEGLLFGIKKGSFTDAEEKDGLFKMADKGTLFLDEMDSMPLRIQAKLLKAIEEKAVRPLGSNEVIYIDVRIIAASSSNARKILESKKIRPDLFFRLSVIQFQLPQLKNRGGDVFEIADYYVAMLNEMHHRDVKGFSADARRLLLKHDWPGNIRELKNIVEGFFAVSKKDIIEESDVNEHLRMGNHILQSAPKKSDGAFQTFAASGLTLKDYLQTEETRLIDGAMQRAGGSVVKAAGELKISPSLLRYKLKEK